MVSILEIIRQDFNPFDLTTSRSRNFWEEEQNQNFTVDSIHKKEFSQIIKLIQLVSKDKRTRSLLLVGDVASGKSYLLGRLKKELSHQAFFAYIGAWTDKGRIWRHILRHTVDSLMHTSEGQKESQLLVWLKTLSAFQKGGLKKKFLGERQLFIQNFKSTYPVGIYRAKEFFGVLYDLTDSNLYDIACDWLKGEDLDNSDLKALGVRDSLDSEDAAQSILSNFGKISSKAKYPIVLCFDQFDHVCLPPDGHIGLQALLGVNTTIHNNNLKNFAIIISLVAQTWTYNKKKIIGADRDRFDAQLYLKSIDLDQAEALWVQRLSPLHKKANPKPSSPIEPLHRNNLEENFPGGKTTPRYTIKLGHQLIQKIKTGTVSEPDLIASFEQIWDKEFEKVKRKIYKIRTLSSPDLTKILKQALVSLNVNVIDTAFLKNKTYGHYSFSYQSVNSENKIGILWNEDPNMRSFFYSMQACEKAIQNNTCNLLILVRAESLGQANNKGYKTFQKIFSQSPHRHITPHLDSVQYLATYSRLINSASSGELVIGYETPNVSRLQELVRQSQVLQKCTLLQQLGVVTTSVSTVDESLKEKDRFLQEVSESILKFVKLHCLLGRSTLLDKILEKHDRLQETDFDRILDRLIKSNQINVVANEKNIKKQLISWNSKIQN